MMRQTIPTYIFDEHNEAFYFWHKAKYHGFLDKALDIFHVDAHSDMLKINQLERSLYYTAESEQDHLEHYGEIALKNMSIANFIIPGILSGLIENVYFIYPKWRNFAKRRKKANVASAFGEGKIIKHDVKVADSEKAMLDVAYPDLREYGYIKTDIEHIPSNREVILDIDLDYFACTDSITNRMRFKLAITADQYVDRQKFLKENEALHYGGLEVQFKREGDNCFAIVQFRKVENRDYFPTESQIQAEVDKLVTVLSEKKIRPAIITICRSCISGYCPPEYFHLIEQYLLKQLTMTFPTISLAN